MLKAHQPEPIDEQRTASASGYPVDPLVSKEDMRRIFGGVSLTTLANWASKPGFPKAIHLSPRCVRYKLSEVSQYLASLQQGS